MIVFGVLYVHTHLRLGTLAKTMEARGVTASKTLHGMMLAAHRIRQQLVPASQLSIKVLRSIKNTYVIHKNFDTEVRREYEIAASDKPLHFWEIKIGVESAADPVEYPDDIDFKVWDEGGREVRYLPIMNDLRRKKLVLFFLPQIEPAEETPRKIVMTYRWPGMVKQINDRHEMVSWIIESKEPVQLAEFYFFLEPGTGRLLSCEVGGPRLEGDAPQEIAHPEKKWPGWVYRLQNVPNDEYSVILKLRNP